MDNTDLSCLLTTLSLEKPPISTVGTGGLEFYQLEYGKMSISWFTMILELKMFDLFTVQSQKQLTA